MGNFCITEPDEKQPTLKEILRLHKKINNLNNPVANKPSKQTNFKNILKKYSKYTSYDMRSGQEQQNKKVKTNIFEKVTRDFSKPEKIGKTRKQLLGNLQKKQIQFSHPLYTKTTERQVAKIAKNQVENGQK